MLSFFLIDLLVLGAATITFWWLSGYDSRWFLRGDEKTERIARIIRCGISLVLVEIAYWGLWRCVRYGDRPAGLLYLLIVGALSFIWIGCITEVLAHAFNFMVDPQQDNREYDPKKLQRELDRIGDLIRSGRKQEAIMLCEALKETADINHSALEMTLEYLGVPQERIKNSHPLQDARRLRAEGKYNEAEAILKTQLQANPSNTDAAFMLMRLYTENMKRVDMAAEVLRSLEQQPHVSRGYVEFARRSLHDWQKPQPQETPAEPVPQTLDELLAKRYFGTATEMLEHQIDEDPNNFEVWMKLVEVHSRYCTNFPIAEKVIKRMGANPTFTAEQMGQAKNKLVEWKSNKPGS